jgi:hypothetical protein
MISSYESVAVAMARRTNSTGSSASRGRRHGPDHPGGLLLRTHGARTANSRRSKLWPPPAADRGGTLRMSHRYRSHFGTRVLRLHSWPRWMADHRAVFAVGSRRNPSRAAAIVSGRSSHGR